MENLQILHRIPPGQSSIIRRVGGSITIDATWDQIFVAQYRQQAHTQ
jgi:hypothetical protein